LLFLQSPPAIFMGMTFPFGVKVIAEKENHNLLGVVN